MFLSAAVDSKIVATELEEFCFRSSGLLGWLFKAVVLLTKFCSPDGLVAMCNDDAGLGLCGLCLSVSLDK